MDNQEQSNWNNYEQPQFQQNQQPQGYQYNGQYSQPYQPPVTDMTIGDWVLTIFLTFIPIVGLVMMIIWAVSSDTSKPSRKNWAIANLIWRVVSWVLTILFSASIFNVIYNMF